jgi:hypothetical protein
MSITDNNYYFDKIKELKGKYYGAQDEYFASNPNNMVQKLSYHKTIKIEPTGTPQSNKSCTFFLPILESNKFVYKNVRFTSGNHDTSVDRCTLECNGSYIDQLYGFMFQTLRHIYNINDNTFIPFYLSMENEYLPKNDNCRVDIRFNEINDMDFSLSVDIYEIINEDFDSNTFTYDKIVPLCQYTGEEDMNHKNINTFKINFNHVINHIIIHTPNGTPQNINLLFDDETISFPVDKIESYNNHYIIKFTPNLEEENINIYGINYSKIDKAKIEIEMEEYENCEHCHIYGVYWNAITMRNNLIGLRFSK